MTNTTIQFSKHTKKQKYTKINCNTKPSELKTSQDLVKYSTYWANLFYNDEIYFQSLLGTGTILIILKNGRHYFAQFIAKETPQHPNQKNFENKIKNTLKFETFFDFKNWVKEKITH